MINPQLPFGCFQHLNHVIYGEQNERVYHRTFDLVVKQWRYATRILKCARTERFDGISENLCLEFSWHMAFANKLCIDLDKAVYERFPWQCPYCISLPCSCKPRGEGKRNQVRVSAVADMSRKPASLAGYQAMFAAIYTRNTLLSSAAHLAEEVGELAEELQACEHGLDRCADVVTEFVDAITNVFGVANQTPLHLENALRDLFRDGCHKCHKAPCRCGFTLSADSVSK